MTVLVLRQTEVSISVWGKPLELGNSLLSTNQRPFIYTGPQALSWRPSTIRSQVGPDSRLQDRRPATTLARKSNERQQKEQEKRPRESQAHRQVKRERERMKKKKRERELGLGFWSRVGNAPELLVLRL